MTQPNLRYLTDEHGATYRIDPDTGLKQYPGRKPGDIPHHRRALHFGSVTLTARFEVKFADMWIGAFWKKGEYDYLPQLQEYDLWVCVVPCLPLHVRWTHREPESDRG